MARIQIVKSLAKEIQKKFKGESKKIISLLKTLQENPHKGKLLGQVAGFQIKELKYKSFRFYFIVDGEKLNFLSKGELVDILMRFVRMSNKKIQQKTIEEIKQILIKLGPLGFE